MLFLFILKPCEFLNLVSSEPCEFFLATVGVLLMLFICGNLFQFLLATVGILLCALLFWNPFSDPFGNSGYAVICSFLLEFSSYGHSGCSAQALFFGVNIISLFCGSLSYLSVRPFGIVHTFLFPLGIIDSLLRLDYHLLWAFSNNLFKGT